MIQGSIVGRQPDTSFFFIVSYILNTDSAKGHVDLFCMPFSVFADFPITRRGLSVERLDSLRDICKAV